MRLIPEGLLHHLLGREGDLPLPGMNRWGNVKRLVAGESYTFINTEMLPIVTPMAVQLAFSLDGVTFTPFVPAAAINSVQVDVIRAVDVQSGPFNDQIVLAPGDAMPFCTTIAKAITISVTNLKEGGGPIWVQVVVCPTDMIDCESITGAGGPWDDVTTATFPASTVGVFDGVIASTGVRQVIIQNNTATDLLLGFGSNAPSLSPFHCNIYLPGGSHAVWESQLGAFTGRVRGLFAAVGLATEFATFTRGINV